MAADATELDRLIEEGLTLYGLGDLDGALLAWERVLAADPANEQANSYVDYVRMNYELLTGEAGDQETAPFGIGPDEPEYQIEILPGDATPSTSAPLVGDAVDEGWFMSEEPSEPAFPAGTAPGLDGPPAIALESTLTLELDADEPRELPEVSFEDATREYSGRPSPPSPDTEFTSEGTPPFGGPQDLQSFGAQTTGVRQRDTGFVKAARPPTGGGPSSLDEVLAPPAGPEPTVSFRQPEPARAKRPSQVPAEVGIKFRGQQDDEPVTTERNTVATPVHDSAYDLMDLAKPGEAPAASPADDLIASLPTPRRTEDLPGAVVPPSPHADVRSFELDTPEPATSTAPTRDLDGVSISFAKSPTTDFSDKPTQEIGRKAALDQLIAAPTRELGLRPPGSTRTPIEDHPKIQQKTEPLVLDTDGTRGDIVLPFDPIDARSAQILDDVDDHAPATETKEDKTRRRITALLEHAATWASGGELDRAVAAVDLALSEDPNSALAQKLIHRNRDQIMHVFQSFLGDLSRMPVLARPLHELANAPISPRAAFLLSRIDGTMSIDEILDVSGMPRLEAYRHLCQLFLRGILR